MTSYDKRNKFATNHKFQACRAVLGWRFTIPNKNVQDTYISTYQSYQNKKSIKFSVVLIS